MSRGMEGKTMTTKYTRRTILRNAAAGSAALAVGANSASFAQDQSQRPNIVFILADDMGYADISCNGRPDFVTPNIDRIAALGARFTQAYANSPVCTASRVAIITGRYQVRLPVGLEERRRPDGACQSERAAQGYLRTNRRRLERLECDHAARERHQLHREQHGQAMGRSARCTS